MADVDVSVLTPVLDEARHLRAAVARMVAQTHPGPVEFLFVDGGSTDGSRELLAELAAQDPRIRVLDNPHRRTPQALNIGLRAARGEFVARMDAHTHYPPDYLALGVARLRRGGAVSVSGPQIAVGDGTWSRRAALALSTTLGTGGASFRRAADDEFEVDTGFTGMWRRDTLVAAGGWDEGWPTDQDCELAFRLSADGGRHVCLPAMAAEYIPRDSLGRLGRQYWQYGLHKVKTFRRHPRAMRPSHLLPPVVAATVLGAVAAPRPVRRVAQAGLGVYASTLAVTAVRADAPAADAAALPLVFATMHLSYGVGLLAGVRRYGVPAAALSSALRRATGLGARPTAGARVERPTAGHPSGVRLAAYEDAIYHRDGELLSAERAFPLFLFALDEDVEALTVLGRLHPAPGRSHYVIGSAAAFEPLPWYPSLGDVRAVLRAAGPTVAKVWRVLGRVDAIWVCGPGPVAVLVALLAVLRRRRVILGVRQDTLAYARSRFPGRRAPQLAFGLMEGVWRALARVAPVATVGPVLHERYAHAPRRHELAVSFVSERDLAGPEVEQGRRGADATTVLSVGRLETEKNPLLLADVLAGLVAGGGRWKLRIVGEGPLEDALRARLEDLGVAEHAELLGYVPLDGGLFDLYRASDLFLHVSWTEGLPQVLLEAFAARLPVVATEVGGVGPIARDAALLIPPGDADAAADAVRRLAGEAQLRAELSERGLERARERTAEAERRRLVAFIAANVPRAPS